MTKQQNKNKDSIHQNKKLSKESLIQGKRSAIPPWAIYALLVLTFLVYLRALFNDFVDFDDDMYIMVNPYIRNFSWEGIQHIFSSFYYGIYHPLTTLTYLFEYKLYGTNPFPYHLLNVILHLINTWIVYKVVLKLSNETVTALFVSALFAVHPMHVESVAWVSERKDVLYSLFYLLSLISYLRYIESGYKKKHYILTLLLFIASLLSKPSAITLFMLLLAVDMYRGRKISIRIFVEKLPFFLLSVLLAVVTNLQPKTDDGISLLYTYTLIERIFLFTYSLAFYLVKLVVPFHLSAIHYHPETGGVAFPWYYYATLPFLILLAWLVIRKTRLRRDKLFGVAFFLITISIMLPVMPIGLAITSERYTYIAYIGLFYVAGQGIIAIKNKLFRKTTLILCALILAAFSYLSWNRVKVWENSITLFTDVIKKYPDNPIAYEYRGNFKYKRLKDFDGALQDYNQSLRLTSSYVRVLKSLYLNPSYVRVLISRGDVYNEIGEYNAALMDYDKILQINPTCVESLKNRSHILLNNNNDYQGALRDLNLLIKLDSNAADAYNNRGIAYANLNDLESALNDFNRTLQMDEVNAEAYNNRGMVYDKMNDTAAALRDFNKAILINPGMDNAYYNKGMLKARTGDLAGALADITKAISINADDDLAYRNRAAIKFMMKDYSGSLEDCNNALKINPKDSIALFNRGQTRLNLNDTAGACTDWNQAYSLGYTAAGDALNRFCK